MACEASKADESSEGSFSVEDGVTADKRSTSRMRRGGTLPSAICLCKAAIGAGVLSMGAHCAEVGFLYTLIALVIGGLLTVVSIRMIGEVSIFTQRWCFEDICDELLHPGVSLFTGFVNSCACLGGVIAYLMICGQILQVLTGCNDSQKQLFIVIIGITVVMPLSLPRHVGFMRHFATLSVTCLVFLVVVVAYILVRRGPDPTATASHVWFGGGDKTIFLYMNSLNNIVFAYNNQFNVPQLTGELNPQAMHRVTWMAVISSLFSCVLYTAVSLTGVLAFGVADNQKDTLILDLAPDKKYWLVVASLVSVMFSCLMACEFHIYPIKQFAAYLVRKARGREANSEKSDKLIFGMSLTRWYDIASTMAIVCLSILVSISLSSVQALFNFVGAFAAAYISYVIPPVWLILIRRQQKGFVWWTPEILFSLAVLSLGTFFFVFGTYSAVAGALL